MEKKKKHHRQHKIGKKRNKEKSSSDSLTIIEEDEIEEDEIEGFWKKCLKFSIAGDIFPVWFHVIMVVILSILFSFFFQPIRSALVLSFVIVVMCMLALYATLFICKTFFLH